MAVQYTQDNIRKNQYTDEQLEDMYRELLALGKSGQRGGDRQLVPSKWNDNEFNVVSGYAIRVAQNSTLDEFKEFIKTGQPVHPVRMTPSEMELLMGGGPVMEWVGAGVAVVGAAAAGAAAACSGD
jgi:hypothetical protein